MSMEAIIQRFSSSLLDPSQLYPQIDLPYYEVDEVEPHGSFSATSSSSSSSPTTTTSEGIFSPEEGDFSDATLKLIDQMLMEEDDLENKDSLALQATEKSFYEVLGQKSPISPDGSDQSKSRASSSAENSDWVREREQREFDVYSDYTFRSILQSISSPSGSTADSPEETRRTEKKTRDRDDIDDDGRSNKQLAPSSEDPDAQLEMYDAIFQCPHAQCEETPPAPEEKPPEKVKAGRKVRGSKNKQKGNPKEVLNGIITKEVVDLRTLLSQCAQAVARADLRSSNELLNKIRKHSTPIGDGTERLAHYFANALEARLAGTGASLYSSFTNKKYSLSDILKGYEIYCRASPYNKASNILANRTIGKLAVKGQTLHIIDFGILWGFQWPCLIQQLSRRPEGPPKLRITGIDFPQPGFRPAEQIEETGRQLARYALKFNVPFEYNAIASKWECVKIEDLRIEKDEVVVVNSMYRVRNVPDETMVEKNSPRDMFLELAKRIKPDLFVLGVLNGMYNAPFFLTRFREALFHFSAGFDMFDAKVGREEWYRMLFEQEVYGRDIMNVVACEGIERVERPETYKQWQARILRAGFRQQPMDQDLLKEVKSKVKAHCHKDFVVDMDGNWVLQGWKGRITNVISCWKPV